MRLEPLYRLRFNYPEDWEVGLPGGWQQHFFIAEGSCEGEITGRFRAANFPLRATSEGPFRPDMRGVIQTDDDATIYVEIHGYGRAYPVGRRQVVGSTLHTSDNPRYERLNDVMCVCIGEVRAADEDNPTTHVVVDVAELIWEPIAP